MGAPHTHVVILAAGKGSRLGALSAESPKWLLDVGGELLADRQLEGIARAQDAIGSVRVVTGHAAGALDRFLAERGQDQIATVFNPDYATINNWYSVLLALRAIEDPEARVIVVNCDMFAEAADMAAFFEACASTEEEALIAVDLERVLTDESMKVEARPDGTLDRIGKVGMDEPVGEYVGMLMARGAELASLRRELEAFVGDPAAVNEWYEGAVGRAAAKGARWTIWPMPSTRWVEIDDDGDLAAAVELVRATR
ncbi:MAG TPA: NTP transferase domain-containing protein [Solirubrobacteraceae bacterium]|jgi:choline kinase